MERNDGRDDSTIEIPLKGNEDVLELSLNDMPPDQKELLEILKDEEVALKYWLQIAMAYYNQQEQTAFLDILETALTASWESTNVAKIAILNALATYYVVHALTPKDPKDYSVKDSGSLLDRATSRVNEADKLDIYSQLSWISKGVLYLARNQTEQAIKQFAIVLQSAPDSLPAALGQAMAFAKKLDWKNSLKNYQRVLKMLANPAYSDVSVEVNVMVRLGIGICFEKLGLLNEAKTAFERVLQLDPENPSAFVLLATLSLNSVKSPSTSTSDRRQFAQQAITFMKRASSFANKRQLYNPVIYARVAGFYVTNNTFDKIYDAAQTCIASVPNIPSSQLDRSAERIPCNNDEILSEAWYYVGVSYHCREQYSDAFNAYQTSYNHNNKFLPTYFGLGQMYIQREDFTKAIDMFEKLREQLKSRNSRSKTPYNKPGQQNGTHSSLNGDDYDTLKMLGYLYSHVAFNITIPNQTTNSSFTSSQLVETLQTIETNLKKAYSIMKQLYEYTPPPTILRDISGSTDLEVLILYARLLDVVEGHTNEGKRKALDIYEKALTIVKKVDPNNLRPELLNNIAVLKFRLSDMEMAEALFTEALQIAVTMSTPEVADSLSTTISYNLARVYEESYKVKEASEIYEKLFSKHPCYVDSNLRLAAIASASNANSAADDQIGSAITFAADYTPAWASRANLQSRLNQIRPSRRTWEHILAKIDRFDIEALTEMGNTWLYLAERESNPKEKLEHLKRAFEFFDKVLKLDQKNPYAANGIAIAVAERGYIREARFMFQQIKEANVDIPHIAVNLAHTMVEINQYQDASRMYLQALKKLENRDVGLLQCVARCFYLMARAQKSIEYMNDAAKYVMRALHMQPSNLELQFDLALIQQQYAQIVLDMPTERRNVELMHRAVNFIDMANPTFARLANLDRHIPYDRKIADQREKHGEILRNKMLKKIDDQRLIEEERQARIDEMKRKRELEESEKERLRIEEEERKLQEQQEIEARRRELLERVRLEAEQAEELNRLEEQSKRRKRDKDGFVIPDSDASESGEDESTDKGKEKRKRKKREKEDGNAASGEKKKKRKLLSRRGDTVRHGAESSDDAGDGEDGQGDAEAAKKKKKKVLSAAIIDDSDEELAGEN